MYWVWDGGLSTPEKLLPHPTPQSVEQASDEHI